MKKGKRNLRVKRKRKRESTIKTETIHQKIKIPKKKKIILEMITYPVMPRSGHMKFWAFLKQQTWRK